MAHHAHATTGGANGIGAADVSNCVSQLIRAFTDGLDIFKRLRERRRKRKSTKKSREKQTSDKDDGAELKLSESLRRGPRDIQERYEKCYGEKGERFARGDAIAHASLAETLIRLNTGLVGIIATFLNHNGGDKEKKRPLHLDYTSLTNLSDASRRDAMNSMQKLYVRLGSQQVVQVQKPDVIGNEKKRKGVSTGGKARGPTVARVQLEGKDKDATQLVFMRPKNPSSTGRKGSMSSSSGSGGSKRTSPTTSPLASPLPLYTPKDPFPFPPANTASSRPKGKCGKVDAFDDACRPPCSPHTYMQQLNEGIPMALHLPPPKQKSPTSPTTAARPARTTPSPPIVRRRMDKATLSTYTFASDSTKLGEIPMRNWTVPWDYTQAQRLNEEAAELATLPVIVAGDKARKRGLFGFLGKGRRGVKM